MPPIDRYGSHLPILEALSNLLPMGRVLELGAGRYSTPFFLSLPNLELLWTIETDHKWFDQCQHQDPRHHMILAENCADNLPPLADFDLIFIDDGDSEAERLRSINAVLSQPHPPTIIHDAEVEGYAQAIRVSGCDHYTFTLTEPHTALVR